MSATLIAAASFGTAIGVVLGMLGGGGAVLTVPVLVAVLGQDVHAATTTSLVVVTGAALVGAARQAGEHHVCWRAAGVFAVAAVPGAVAGSYANAAAGGRLILGLLGALILSVALLTWRRGGTGLGARPGPQGGCPSVPLAVVVLAGVTLGALTGFFGVGGGFALVPALAFVLRFPFRLAIGTSLVIIALVSLVGLATHLAHGARIDWSVTTPFAVATVAGSLLGASLSPRVPQAALARMFAVLLVGVGVATMVSVV